MLIGLLKCLLVLFKKAIVIFFGADICWQVLTYLRSLDISCQFSLNHEAKHLSSLQYFCIYFGSNRHRNWLRLSRFCGFVEFEIQNNCPIWEICVWTMVRCDYRIGYHIHMHLTDCFAITVFNLWYQKQKIGSDCFQLFYEIHPDCSYLCHHGFDYFKYWSIFQ